MRTMKSPTEIDALFKSGRRGSTDLLVVLSADTPSRRGPEGRVVFVAGKKLGGAVARNRSKRVMREAVRRTGVDWPGRDVALIARLPIGTAAPDAIDRALRAGLRKAGIE